MLLMLVRVDTGMVVESGALRLGRLGYQVHVWERAGLGLSVLPVTLLTVLIAEAVGSGGCLEINLTISMVLVLGLERGSSDHESFLSRLVFINFLLLIIVVWSTLLALRDCLRLVIEAAGLLAIHLGVISLVVHWVSIGMHGLLLEGLHHGVVSVVGSCLMVVTGLLVLHHMGLVGLIWIGVTCVRAHWLGMLVRLSALTAGAWGHLRHSRHVAEALVGTHRHTWVLAWAEERVVLAGHAIGVHLTHMTISVSSGDWSLMLWLDWEHLS